MGLTRLGDDAGDIVEIEAIAKSLRVSPYPRDSRFYTVDASTGILAAALAADTTLFSMRQAAAPTKTIYITGIRVSFACTVAFTAGSQIKFVYERFSTATPSGGTARTPIRHLNTDPASEAADIRAATTGALTVTSVVFEGRQVPILGLASPLVSTVQFQPAPLPLNPIKLAANEGFCIKNALVWPVAGTGVLTCSVEWEER